MKKVTMKSQHPPSAISINEDKYITRDQLNSLLKTYNYFYVDQENLQLSYNQPEGSKPVIEGILAIFWGLRRPIRLKIQDEKQIPPFVTLKSPERVGLFPSKRGMMRWGEFDNLYHISEETPNSSEEPLSHEKGCSSYESSTLKPRSVQEPTSLSPHRTRAMSDTLQVRKRANSPTDARKEVEKHRFSINGHFYNYETSIFTPAFGSETKIRINSNMKTGEVIEQLLQKFKIENSPQEFALYIIHASGEKKRLKNTDTPLLERLLQGPSEQIAQFFLMDKNSEEVTSDVAQYLKFHVPLLESILQKLNEEEGREIEQTIAKYNREKDIILQHLNSKRLIKTETAV
uniref:Ras association domain family member 6 n=1 Tax=Pelodiscus sinensis TaxID=13735 RepID=K7FPX2_PELSI|nr:ras association domain-containing protein 6 [Pelodiscus sinensis]XP_025041599.1 ras association domain-containing protein 6 [Pelodiscus sinensis]XP_025041600.1 ras association domain-containing protein 6 [Pelodiscus sinensis]XP_025041601.1 ras association domain-containing protein 6 [Pelodiscus sinensis]XP_025041602.1 ras association domain-containing protein 6 [Pelodiscus sinensis]XP_025041603.1 ras association domain-containing protein 6 [Pelodiscus sinensis]|eukprot:XP_014430244.1 ras association domain-containing protein 6 [Pelodiscus sinensis]